jgi:hypothetical protein
MCVYAYPEVLNTEYRDLFNFIPNERILHQTGVVK